MRATCTRCSVSPLRAYSWITHWAACTDCGARGGRSRGAMRLSDEAVGYRQHVTLPDSGLTAMERECAHSLNGWSHVQGVRNGICGATPAWQCHLST